MAARHNGKAARQNELNALHAEFIVGATEIIPDLTEKSVGATENLPDLTEIVPSLTEIVAD